MAALSRRTTRILADLYVSTFTKYARSSRASVTVLIDTKALYTCVYEADCEAWLCSNIERQSTDERLHPFILKLHTGESVNAPTWGLPQRVKYGQKMLLELCTAILRADDDTVGDDELKGLRSALELDGYVFRNGKLLRAEGETQDVEAERGELAQLYVDLRLPNRAIVEDCLAKSEEHYAAGNYRDCIANARHYVEKILHDVATEWSKRPGEPPLIIKPGQPAAGPCRNYLKDVGVFSEDEKNVFKELHGLLSGTGGHPALPEREAARVFRRLATSMGLYALLQYQAMK